jgi:hypothetical protein
MRSLKLGLVATAALICAFSVSAQAGGSCVRIGALGDGLTHDLAVIMSTHGLANIIEGKGLTPKGPVRTHCDAPGTFVTECHSSQMACK